MGGAPTDAIGRANEYLSHLAYRDYWLQTRLACLSRSAVALTTARRVRLRDPWFYSLYEDLSTVTISIPSSSARAASSWAR